MLNTTITKMNDNVTVSDRTDGSQTDADEENPVEATPPGYDLDVIFRTIGNASSTCECCGDLVDGHDLEDWIICDLDVVDFSDESHALVCRDCRETKPDWKQRVLERRRDQKINSRLDTVAHWVSRAPVETLFLRRAAAGIALILAATALTTVMAALTSGLGPTFDSLATANWDLIAVIGTLLFTTGYWLHLHERERNDRRGTTVREHNLTDGPWAVLGFASAGLGIGTVLMVFGTNFAQVAAGISIYAASAVVVFTNLEVAVRADRCHQRVNWIPRYDRELFGLRMSIVVGIGLLASGITVGALVPAVAIPAYLFARKWYDLGPNWRMLYHNGGDDE